MKTGIRLGVALAVLVLAATVYILRPAANTDRATNAITVTATGAQLPRLLDLGADKCVPCKMMAPILVALKTEFAEVFTVEFVDVWKNPAAAEPYGLKVIPTQIFFSAEGAELFRHEGFFGRDDILAKWREFGVEVPAGKPAG